MRRPRVLYVSHGHPSIVRGGGEQYAFELFQGMREEGDFEPYLVARVGSAPSDSRHVHPGTRVYSFERDPQQYLILTQPDDFDGFTQMSRDREIATRHFRELLLSIAPDVVHFQHTTLLGLDFVRAARTTLPQVPIVYTLHEFLPICYNSGQMVRTETNELCETASPRRCSECFPERSPADFFLRARLIQQHFDLVDLFIAPSQQLRQRYIAWGIPADRIRFEEYGRRLDAQPVAPQSRARRNRFAYFGQANVFKGIDVVLKASMQLERHGLRSDEFDIQINGVGAHPTSREFNTRFATLIESVGSHVTMAGRYSADDLPRLMAKTDWVIVPSIWWENSPLVIQEAFAYGRPVICSDVGGMAEKVRHDVDGLHFHRGDFAHLAETMALAASQPGLWERLHSAIRAPHSMPTHLATLSSVYHELRGRRRDATSAHA